VSEAHYGVSNQAVPVDEYCYGRVQLEMTSHHWQVEWWAAVEKVCFVWVYRSNYHASRADCNWSVDANAYG
jgi:hypothetical protein